MFNLCWFVISGLFCGAVAVIKLSQHNGNDKSVNLALETVFEFNNQDKKSDVNLLQKVERFIGKVKNVIEKNNVERRRLGNKNKQVFSNFITDVIKVLNEYDDTALQTFIVIFTQELKNHHYKGCKFHELGGDIEQQRDFEYKLADIRTTAGSEIRNKLREIASKIYEENFVESEKELVDTLNSAYNEDLTETFREFLRNIGDYRTKASRDVIDIKKVIGDGLKTILFDHYTNLTDDLRTKVKAKVQAYVDYCTRKTSVSQNPASSTTTKSKQGLRTQRQMYVQRDLELQYPTKAKRNGKRQTQKTHRPHSVPTTRKSKPEHREDVLRSKRIERYDKKSRFLKVGRQDDEIQTTPKKRLTKEPRTLRQMYVEKNIDLKYDPDAYEHLTTEKSSKKKKSSSVRQFYSPTTRKRRTKTTRHSTEDSHSEERVKKYKTDDDNSKERHKKLRKKHHSYEIALKDFGSFETKSSKKQKVTKMNRHFGQTLIDQERDYRFDHPEYRSNNKKTAKTMYPTFIINWETTQPQVAKSKSESLSYKVRLPKHGNGYGQFYTYQPADQDGVQPRKYKDSIEVKQTKNLRYQQQRHIQDKPRNSVVRLQRANRHQSENVPIIQRQDEEHVSKKVKMSRDPAILARQYVFPRNIGRKKYRTQDTQKPAISEEGLSIEGLNYKRKFSRRNAVPNISVDINGNNVLKRIQNLENELELVKIRMKNETESKKKLNVNKEKRKVTQKQKIAKSVSPKLDLTVDESSEMRNSNTNEINIESPEFSKKDNFNTNKQIPDLKNDDKSFEIFKNKNQAKSNNTMLLANDSFDSDASRSRKAFPDLIVADDVKINLTKQPNDPKSKTNVQKNPIARLFTEFKEPVRNTKEGKTKSEKETTEKLIFFRANDKDMDEMSFNDSAEKDIKHKNDSVHILNEVKSENNNELQVKTIVKENDAKEHTVITQLQLNDSKELKDKEIGRVVKDTSFPDTTPQNDLLKKEAELSKVNDKNNDIVANNKSSTVIEAPTSNITASDSKVLSEAINFKKEPFSNLPTTNEVKKEEAVRDEKNKEELTTPTYVASTKEPVPLQENSMKEDKQNINATLSM